MKLRGIEFGNILGASGVQGFFGEGYWFHKVFKPFGLDFTGMTFVAKTTTLLRRDGNMPLRRDYTPQSLVPNCIKARPWSGNMLNAVGLSGPGLSPLLQTGQWQERTTPFWISFMSVAATKAERLDELARAIVMLRMLKRYFKTTFGLQINVSCPNTGHNTRELIGEILEVVEIAKALDVPIMLKFAVDTATPEDMLVLQDHPDCDAICVSNTIKFGSSEIDWHKVWGDAKSPLADLGGGGLSGEALRPLVCDWIKRLRDKGFTKPINGGGGILHPAHILEFYSAGASSVFIGSIAALRPWRVKATIEMANNLIWE